MRVWRAGCKPPERPNNQTEQFGTMFDVVLWITCVCIAFMAMAFYAGLQIGKGACQ